MSHDRQASPPVVLGIIRVLNCERVHTQADLLVEYQTHLQLPEETPTTGLGDHVPVPWPALIRDTRPAAADHHEARLGPHAA
ncbi:hypothetical protein [Austwickia chelonae]|uniref:hypothetical protein n=1 Tax=Austwickia chelonae TaxID=100225 RepID=UPI000E25AB4B|nr:hypothetical protein [Austwickia chelonae]